MDQPRFEVEQLLGGHRRAHRQAALQARVGAQVALHAVGRRELQEAALPLLRHQLAFAQRARRAEHRAHVARAARLRVDGYRAEQPRVDLGNRRRAQPVHRIQHQHASLRVELRQRASVGHAQPLAQRRRGVVVLEHHHLGRLARGVLRPRARAGEEAAARLAQQRALVFEQHLVGKRRRAPHADVRALRGHELVRRSHRGVDARHVRAELARGARAVHQHDILHAARRKTQQHAFLHARETGHFGVLRRVGQALRRYARACEHGLPAGCRHGGRHAGGEVLVQRAQRDERLHRAYRGAGAARHASLAVKLQHVVGREHRARRTGVRAFRARRMAVAHHHAAIARQVHGLRLQRLGHFHDVYQVRHANSSSRLPLLLEKRLLDGA